MKLVLTAFLVFIAINPLSAQTITIARIGTQASQQGPAANFTGSVRVDPLFQPTGANRASGSLVTFDAGAHSAWHTHATGQVLIVTAGTGRVQQWNQPMDEIRVGDVVRIPPDVKHWHGAAPATSMAHISVVEQPANGAAVVWMEKVSPEQYKASLRDVRPAAATLTAARSEPTAAQRIMGDIAPALADLTDRVLFGEVWARPQLSQRDRSLVTISALIAMNRPDQFRSHLARARANGVTQEEAVEVITHLAFYSGWPNAVMAVGVAREVFNAETQPRP
jgi:4-carboxymuconolactone decarboxylase